jgi:Protein of unknown function (DUF3592)
MSPHTFEPELDQPTPRRVAAREGCAYGCGLWFVRLFALPHTLAGPFLLYQAGRAIVLYLGVLLAGTEVEGTITKTAEHTGKKGTSYTADYVYTLDGAEYTAQTSLDADEFATLRKGQAIPVRVWEVAPDDAHWAGVSGNHPLRGVGGACFGAGIWNGALAVFIYFFYVRPWRRRWLVRYGVPTPGVVRSVAVVHENKQLAYKVRYEYAVPAGHRTAGGRYTGSVKASKDSGAADVRVGDVLTVLYDPWRPWGSLLYRFADHKAVKARPTGGDLGPRDSQASCESLPQRAQRTLD